MKRDYFFINKKGIRSNIAFKDSKGRMQIDAINFFPEEIFYIDPYWADEMEKDGRVH